MNSHEKHSDKTRISREALQEFIDEASEYDCKAVLRNLLRFVHGECCEVSHSRIEEHIDDCKLCGEEVLTEEKWRSLLVKKCCNTQAPQHLHEAISTRISKDCGEFSYVHIEERITYYKEERPS